MRFKLQMYKELFDLWLQFSVFGLFGKIFIKLAKMIENRDLEYLLYDEYHDCLNNIKEIIEDRNDIMKDAQKIRLELAKIKSQ